MKKSYYSSSLSVVQCVLWFSLCSSLGAMDVGDLNISNICLSEAHASAAEVSCEDVYKNISLAKSGAEIHDLQHSRKSSKELSMNILYSLSLHSQRPQSVPVLAIERASCGKSPNIARLRLDQISSQKTLYEEISNNDCLLQSSFLSGDGSVSSDLSMNVQYSLSLHSQRSHSVPVLAIDRCSCSKSPNIARLRLDPVSSQKTLYEEMSNNDCLDQSSFLSRDVTVSSGTLSVVQISPRECSVGVMCKQEEREIVQQDMCNRGAVIPDAVPSVGVSNDVTCGRNSIKHVRRASYIPLAQPTPRVLMENDCSTLSKNIIPIDNKVPQNIFVTPEQSMRHIVMESVQIPSSTTEYSADRSDMITHRVNNMKQRLYSDCAAKSMSLLPHRIRSYDSRISHHSSQSIRRSSVARTALVRPRTPDLHETSINDVSRLVSYDASTLNISQMYKNNAHVACQEHVCQDASLLELNVQSVLLKEAQIAACVGGVSCGIDCIQAMLGRTKNFVSFSGGGMKIAVQMEVARWLENALDMRMFHFIDYAGAVSAGSITMSGLLMHYNTVEIVNILTDALRIRSPELGITIYDALFKALQSCGNQGSEHCVLEENVRIFEIIYNTLFRHVINVFCKEYCSVHCVSCNGNDASQKMLFLKEQGVSSLCVPEEIDLRQSAENITILLNAWKKSISDDGKWLEVLDAISKQTSVPKFTAESLHQYILDHGDNIFSFRNWRLWKGDASCGLSLYSNQPLYDLLKGVFGDVKYKDISVPIFVLTYEMHQKNCYVLHNQMLDAAEALNENLFPGWALAHHREAKKRKVQVKSTVSLPVVDAIMASASIPHIFGGYPVSIPSSDVANRSDVFVMHDGGIYSNSAIVLADKIFPPVVKCCKICITCGEKEESNAKSCDSEKEEPNSKQSYFAQFCNFVGTCKQKMWNSDVVAQLYGDIIINPSIPAKYMGCFAGLNGSRHVQEIRSNAALQYLRKEGNIIRQQLEAQVAPIKEFHSMVNSTLLNMVCTQSSNKSSAICRN